MEDVVIPAFRLPPGPYQVVRWRKQEGEQVRQGEVLCLLVTKAHVPVEMFAPVDGRLQHVYAAEGGLGMSLLTSMNAGISPLAW